MDRNRIILDTDIGTDVDDCLALALILGSPELELVGVTTVYGDVALRARMALKLLRLRGAGAVPVAMGAGRPLLGRRDVYWEGHEGVGLLGWEDEALMPSSEHAVDFIVRTVMEHPGQITLVAIGPLTNVALAFLREPGLADQLAGLTVMGGVIGGAGALHLPWTEHNFRCDPEAAHIVISARSPTAIVPLDVTTRVRIRPDGVSRIRAFGDAYHQAVADQVDLYPGFARRGWTHLHDPLAVATLIEPELVTWAPVQAFIGTQGELTPGQLLARLPKEGEAANATVALEVDVARAEEFVIGRVAS